MVDTLRFAYPYGLQWTFVGYRIILLAIVILRPPRRKWKAAPAIDP
jgi:hypothetical protein